MNKDNNKDIIVLAENKNSSNTRPEEISNNITENNELNHQNTNNKINDSSADNSNIENNEENYTHSNITSDDNSNSCIFKNKKCLLIIGLISFAVIIAIVVILCIVLKKSKPNNPIPSPPEVPGNENETIIDPPTEEEEKPPSPINPPKSKNEQMIERELYIKNNVKDLKSVYVNQNSTENITSNGILSEINFIRKTNYEYFFLSEEDPDEENKNFYEKKYTVALLISSQCFSFNGEDCTPKQMIDIKKVKSEDIQNSLRRQDEKIDLKDLPIPLCLMNLTDNNVILSISCPQKLHKNIIQNIILDTYFYRLPAIVRPDITKNNITMNKWEENGYYFIRELNRGICDIQILLILFVQLI